MNAIVINSHNTFSDWFSAFRNKFNRWVYKIGYLRAARELDRIGYTDLAEKCREDVRSL